MGVDVSIPSPPGLTIVVVTTHLVKQILLAVGRGPLGLDSRVLGLNLPGLLPIVTVMEAES
jgi:hypothetical protein